MPVDSSGNSLDGRKSSAETPVHTLLYAHDPKIRCVLHTHSIYATMLSKNIGSKLKLDDYELLKAFRGIATHQTRIIVPVFPNDQDIKKLAEKVIALISDCGPCFGFQSADVASLTPDHPDKKAFREKILNEHTHSDIEVRFFVDGSGLFYIHSGTSV